ncbi:MAG: EpsG family protein, partial [Bacillota bacterium]|nr:EpsG family protein [Bacillota bacterium]
MVSLVIYLGCFTSSSIFGAVLQRTPMNSLNNKIKCIILFVLTLSAPVVLSTIRYNIGTDYINYEAWFIELQNGKSVFEGEILFNLLNVFADKVFGEFWAVLFLSALIIYGFITLSLYNLRNSVSIALGIWIFNCFYFTASLNIMRQIIAVAIVLYAITKMLEKKPLVAIVMFIIATLFHTTAIISFVFIIIYYIGNINRSLYRYVLCTVAVLLILYGGEIIQILIEGLPEKYGLYFSSNLDGYVDIGFLIGRIPIITLLFLPIIISVILKIDFNNEYLFISNILYFTVLIYILSYFWDYGGRSIFYFDICQVICGPHLVYNSRRNKPLLYFIFVFRCYCYRCWRDR